MVRLADLEKLITVENAETWFAEQNQYLFVESLILDSGLAENENGRIPERCVVWLENRLNALYAETFC